MDDRYDLEDGGDLPPPYSASTNQTRSVSVPGSDSQQSLSIFSSYVASLRSEITASQAARASARDDRDGQVLSIVVPYVQDFLTSISELNPTPRLAEATFVPHEAISEDWKFSDEDERRSGEYRTLIRIHDPSKKGEDKKKTGSYYQSERGGGDEVGLSLWWENEDMARRLAKYLQPQRPPAPKTLITRDRKTSQTSGSKKSGIWGIFKKSDEPCRSSATLVEQPKDGVVMTVKAEEVTFRKQNDFGLWETLTGFGIVVCVRIRPGGGVRSI